MAVDGLTIYALKHELTAALKDGRISKIYQPEKHLVTLDIRVPGKTLRLIICVDPNSPRIHLADDTFDNPFQPPAFCMLLRKHFENGRIRAIRQPRFDRILEFVVEKQDETGNFRKNRLVAEIMGRHSNLIAVSPEDVIFDGLIHVTEETSSYRRILPNVEYIPPPPQDKLEPIGIGYEQLVEKIRDTGLNIKNFRLIMNNVKGFGPLMAKELLWRAGFETEEKTFAGTPGDFKDLWQAFQQLQCELEALRFQPTIYLSPDDGHPELFTLFELGHLKKDYTSESFDDVSGMLTSFYRRKRSHTKERQLRERLERIVKKQRKKIHDRRMGLKERQKEAERAEEFRKKGELIKANIYRLEKGEEQVEVEDFFVEETPKVIIELDPALGPAENAQRYFQKYDKAKRSKKKISRELSKLRLEEKYLADVEYALEESETTAELEEIASELTREGYISEKKKRTSPKRQARSKPMQFVSPQGYTIYVGRNNDQNDRVTFEYASGDDLWMHVQKMPGSHVIIKNHTQKELPRETVELGARLAAYFSRGRNSSNVPVDYTQRKNVRKPRGAKPGMVIYRNHRTCFITPSRDVLRELKKQA